MIKQLKKIRIAIIGVGNCASSLVQGIEYYKSHQPIGIMHHDIGGYKIKDIKPVVAFDIDARKVGKDISQAIFALPNCTRKICDVPYLDAPVYMGPISDGVSPHMLEHPNKDQTFIVADIEPVDVVTMLKKYKAEIVVNYLPVGSEKATKIYAEAAIDAGCAFVNCIPSFVASDPKWAARFKAANLPVLGDDIKSQLGATFMHRTLMQVALDRGLRIVSTSQYNQGGNTDFLNMTAEHRLKHKLESKQSSIMELLDKDRKLEQKSYFGPGEFDVSYQKKGHGWRDGQKDNKTAEINLEGKMWGDTPCSYKINLSVEDSPDSAGCVADVIRCTKLALDRKLSGCIEDACYYFFKHPIRQISDAEARSRLQSFIQLSNHNL